MEEDHPQHTEINGRIIYKWVLHRMGGCGVDSCGSGYKPVESTCEHDSKPGGVIRCGNHLTSYKAIRYSRMTLLHGTN